MILKLKNIFSLPKTFKPLILSVFIFILFAFSACSDDPVTTQEPEFDPPRFEWKVDTLNGYIADIWAENQNNVFLAGTFGKWIYYNGQIYQYINYDNDFGAYTITGLDRFNVYFGGIDFSTLRPMLKKWNGTAFENTIVNDTSNGGSGIISLLANSSGEIWMGSSNGRVYMYNGISLNTYYFDSLMAVGPFMKDISNNLYFTGGIVYVNPPNDSAKSYIYKFNGNSWDLIYYKFVNNKTTDTLLNIHNIGSDIAGVNYNGIRRFNGTDFQKIIEPNGFSIYPRFYGNSFSDILCPGTQDGYIFKIHHWNGLKWSNENTSVGINLLTLFGAFDSYYCASYDYSFEKTFLYIGKPLNQGRFNMLK